MPKHDFTHTLTHAHTHSAVCQQDPTPQYEYTPQLKELDSHRPELPETNPLLKGAHHSPLQVAAWSAALRSHPDTEFVGYILEGMQHGFRVGFNYKKNCTRPAYNNLISAKTTQTLLGNTSLQSAQKGGCLGPSQHALCLTSKSTELE